MKVLFVCLGNICRSPLAEGIFAHLVQTSAAKFKITCDSAGTAGYHTGSLPDERSCLVAAKNGITLKHKARKLSSDDFKAFDLIVAMDKNNLMDIEKLRPEGNTTTVKLMRSYDEFPSDSPIPDPYYGDFSDFEKVYELLEHSCGNLLNQLSKTYDS